MAIKKAAAPSNMYCLSTHAANEIENESADLMHSLCLQVHQRQCLTADSAREAAVKVELILRAQKIIDYLEREDRRNQQAHDRFMTS